MNVIIYGKRASGKTILAEQLAKYYRRKKQKVTIINDDIYTMSRKEYDQNLKKALEILSKTKDNKREHIIITTQASPDMIFRFYSTVDEPSLYDYKYHTMWEGC